MLKKDPSKDAKTLADDANQAYEMALGERAAFDMDIGDLATAAFRLNKSKEEFVSMMQAKYPVQDKTYVQDKSLEAWKVAKDKV